MRDTEVKTRQALLPTRRRVLLGLLLVGAAPASACGPPPRGTIGAVLIREESNGRVFLRDVPAHLAAGRAGLRPGDEILLIDGQDVRRLLDPDLRRILGGAVGEKVELTIARGPKILVVELKRSMAEPYRVK